MLIRAKDPLDDFARHDRKQAERLRMFPVCSECGEPIQDEFYYNIYNVFFCESCLQYFKEDTAVFIERGTV